MTRSNCFRVIGVASLAAGLLTAFAAPALAQEGGRPLKATLNGTAGPGTGDADGAGTATFRVNLGQKQVCYDLQVSNIGPATAAHIHKAAAGASGPPVVPMATPSADGKASACATADEAVVKDILQNPQGYYVNVHNAEFPAGAVRGQLSK